MVGAKSIPLKCGSSNAAFRFPSIIANSCLSVFGSINQGQFLMLWPHAEAIRYSTKSQ